ncbi:ABC transporter ATP-binding protein [Pseudonocardiaceae bacterium YIM PH 21723]|nr:ABC transporter ATP-binding protein [Pseudonocardiaceae bacterium YIM PH 21723]
MVREPAGAATPAAPGLAARTEGLRKVFRGTVAVDDVNLAVPDGAVLGLLGPNGSGKTTTIRMLLGLTAPTAGHVELFGHRMPEAASRVLPEVGALVEGPGFHPYLSGRGNLFRLAAAEPLLNSRDADRAVSEALDRVGLSDAANRAYKGYSLGMKQRLGLAAALLVPRRLVVLDEPTNGLDPAGTREIRQVIGGLRAAGTTVIVSSHLLAEIEATCTHVAVMNKGVVVAQGPLRELLSDGSSTVDVSTSDTAAAAAVLRDNGFAAQPIPEGLRVELGDRDSAELIRQLVLGGVPVHEATRRRGGLEELFATLTEEERG